MAWFRLAAALALCAIAGAAQAPPDFAYDAARPLGVTYGKVQRISASVSSRSISFVSPTGHTVSGEIIEGGKGASHPGVLFVHWLGDPKTTNHTEFEADAIALAGHGVTSLLVDTMWAKPDWFEHMGVSAESDYAESTAQVIDLRRALDVLTAQPGIDPARIAYVGHDFGAMFGALLSGVDARPKFYVLMAGTSSLSEWYLLEHHIKDAEAAAYVEKLAPLDILGSLQHAKAKAYLFQFSAHDHYIPHDRAQAFFEAAPLPRGVFYYDVDHSLAVRQAFSDRQAWLAEQLLGN